jgi:hypothetical protein
MIRPATLFKLLTLPKLEPSNLKLVAISRIRPVIMERAVLRYCGTFTLATLSVMTGLIRDIAVLTV